MVYDVKAALVEVKTSNESLFGSLSKELGLKIAVSVHAAELLGDDLYLVLGLILNAHRHHADTELIRSNVMNRFAGRSVEYFVLSPAHSAELPFLAVKRVCAFYKMIEESRVVLLNPYIHVLGVRRFAVLGGSKELDQLFEALLKRYGAKNVRFEIVRRDIPRRLLESQFEVYRESVLNALTQRELEVLVEAYRSGYFKPVKDVKLDELAQKLSVSKNTVSLLLRKSVMKLLKQIFTETESTKI